MSDDITLVKVLNSDLRDMLDAKLLASQHPDEISYARPDPILIASRFKDPLIALICALYGYGRADIIVRFLDSLDFCLLEADEEMIRHRLGNYYYRFQSREDVVQSFVTFSRARTSLNLEACFVNAYRREQNVLDGLNALIDALYGLNPYRSRGYRFLLGSPVRRVKGGAPLKRWMMFLRWMVRKDAIDFGLWKNVDTADLLMPLDTHTFSVSRTLGLLKRKTYDLQSAMELTEALRRFDPADPVKYDFALYRIGQEPQFRR